VQVHGGMGFIEETGAAQYYRDARILTIYEGTTAIQANDLVGRKTARDGGQTAKAIAARSSRPRPSWRQRQRCRHRPWPAAWAGAPCLWTWWTSWWPGQGRPNAVYAGSVPYLMLAGNLVAGWQMARALLVAEARLAQGRTRPSCGQDRTARFYAEHTCGPGLREPSSKARPA
jgi:hypothetical protein